MSRISSQGSVLMIDDPANYQAPAGIASATKAKPCVITMDVADGAMVVGAIVVPRNTGWASLDDMPFKVSDVALLVVTLEDSDTSGEVADIKTTAVDPLTGLDHPAWLELCRSNFTANSPAGATIDVTTLCDTAHRIVPGLPAIGTWNAAGFYDCGDVALERARDAYRSGEDVLIDVRLPDGCGFTFGGVVNTYDVTLGVNAAVTNTLGGLVDGLIHFYKTPPVGFVAPGSMARLRRPRVPAAPEPRRDQVGAAA